MTSDEPLPEVSEQVGFPGLSELKIPPCPRVEASHVVSSGSDPGMTDTCV